MKHREIELESKDGKFTALLTIPARTPAPGLVLLQEIFGVNKVMRATAERFAAAGYLVITPDLFWRQAPRVQLDPASAADRETAMRLFKGMVEPLAVADAAIALEKVRSMPECTGEVGALGYCLGGKLAYLLAASTDVDASVSYYGVGIDAALNEARNVRCPLLLHIAEKDRLSSPEAQRRTIDAFRGMEHLVTIHVYPGAGHAFARPGGADYDEAAASSADERTLSFLKRFAGN